MLQFTQVLLLAVYAISASAKTVSYDFNVGWVTVGYCVRFNRKHRQQIADTV